MLNKLEIKSTDSSLSVLMDAEKNHFVFEGESRPENCTYFFQPILQWLKSYKTMLVEQKETTVLKVDFKLDYFNSTSAKFITDIFIA